MTPNHPEIPATSPEPSTPDAQCPMCEVEGKPCPGGAHVFALWKTGVRTAEDYRAMTAKSEPAKDVKPDAQTALVPSTALAPALNDDFLKAIAMDIGKEVTAYISIMYPEAVEATSSTFLLSVRNTVHNQIVSAVRDPKYGETPEQWLARRAKWRREWKAQWKKIRETPTPADPVKRESEPAPIPDDLRDERAYHLTLVSHGETGIYHRQIVDLIDRVTRVEAENATLKQQLAEARTKALEDRRIAQAAIGVRKHGSDYKNGTHAKFLWDLVDRALSPLPKENKSE